MRPRKYSRSLRSAVHVAALAILAAKIGRNRGNPPHRHASRDTGRNPIHDLLF